jgi:hypothetical protein
MLHDGAEQAIIELMRKRIGQHPNTWITGRIWDYDLVGLAIMRFIGAKLTINANLRMPLEAPNVSVSSDYSLYDLVCH